MKAIYDKNNTHVGWFSPHDQMIYNSGMVWIGFVVQKNVFTKNTRWVGGMVENTLVDKNGKAVAVLYGNQPQNTLPLLPPLRPLQPLTPLRPLQPLTPLTPIRPIPPVGGWSNVTWRNYWIL